MGSFRNPMVRFSNPDVRPSRSRDARSRSVRFAPELLEGRLMPTPLLPTSPTPTIDVAAVGTSKPDPEPSPTGDGTPPVILPNLPTPGPAVPA